LGLGFGWKPKSSGEAAAAAALAENGGGLGKRVAVGGWTPIPTSFPPPPLAKTGSIVARICANTMVNEKDERR